jgi:hypothetical protein
MGRSFNFTYKNIMKFDGTVPEQNITTINNLKIGDRFTMKITDYMISNEDELYIPLTRTPSSYGLAPVPLCDDCSYEYIVENVNDEPGLLVEKGLRSISFTVYRNDTKYFKTHRLITDGTIRECEGLGINFVIDEINII